MEVQAFVQGQFTSGKSGLRFENRNPYELDQDLGSWTSSEEYQERAILSAKESPWAEHSQSDRIEHIRKLQSVFEKHETTFEDAIVLEAGKARWEARKESQALAAKIKTTLEVMLPMVESLKKSLELKGSQELEFRPRGVCLVIGPFNFPLHLANGHIIPALLAGNTVIFKPSELTSGSATLYAKAFEEAGFPPGSFQLLPGGAQLGDQLVRDPRIDAVFFTGSYAVGEKITKALLETRQDLSTIAALELGGKNAAIVHEDAHFQQALGETLLSAYATTGQRCSCASRVFVHESIFQKFKTEFVKSVSEIPYGDPSHPKTFMGPLVSESALDKFFRLYQSAKEEGFEFLKESKKLKNRSCLVSPSVSLSTEPELDVHKESLKEEFFGPHCSLIPYKDLDQLVELHEASPYGLVSSFFSSDEEKFRYLGKKLNLGLFNWNRATVGASGRLPFGGNKKSGNNWPAGISAFFYCTKPQSILLQSKDSGVDGIPDTLKGVVR